MKSHSRRRRPSGLNQGRAELETRAGDGAIAWFRTGAARPKWFARLAIVVGMVLILPEGFFLTPLALLWVAIVSISLFRRGATTT